jgi:two-component system, chemotaxis family, CheB/CheR fusion protein
MSPAEARDAKFEDLLEYLRHSRGFDFTGYKRPSLTRRIDRRMQSLGIEAFADYVDYLEVHPEEFTALFNTILINVTSFFRDPAAWECVAERVIPRLISGKAAGEGIRIWSAGCATGEEAYSAAMLLCEAMGREEFKRRVKVYATDVDEEALTIARQATYTEKEIQAVPDAMRHRYFESAGGRYVFQAELRRSVIFGRHNLVQDAPMSRLDLLICRNVLMYFNAETQARIVGRFNYALNNDGCLFLGKAEMLLMHSNLFSPLEMRYRIFCKQTQVSLRDRLLVFGQSAASGADVNHSINRHVRLRNASFEFGEIPQVLIDTDGVLLLANHQARQLFDVDQKDLGRPFQDLELSYRPLELRSLIEQAYTERRIITLANVEKHFKNNSSRYFDVHVMPLFEGETPSGVCITFNDVTSYHKLEDEVLKARQESETVHEELQAANEELQSTNEELETTNEELQSTNEELETTNEELQSTNEELETMNEELQSSNEELQTINDEHRERTEELNEANTFLNSILSSLRGGVVVVDKDFNILVWNYLAEDLWGLRSDEVKGQSLFTLDIGLPVSQLRHAIRASTSDGGDMQELILDAVNRRGRNIKCRVTVNPFRPVPGDRQGAVIMMEEMGM